MLASRLFLLPSPSYVWSADGTMRIGAHNTFTANLIHASNPTTQQALFDTDSSVTSFGMGNGEHGDILMSSVSTRTIHEPELIHLLCYSTLSWNRWS